MKSAMYNTTVTSTKVEDIYEYTISAVIDGANRLVTLDKRHMNKVNGFDDRSMFILSIEDIKTLYNQIHKLEDLDK